MVPHILEKQRPCRPSRQLGWPTILFAIALGLALGLALCERRERLPRVHTHTVGEIEQQIGK